MESAGRLCSPRADCEAEERPTLLALSVLHESDADMRNAISWFIHGLSWLAAVVALLAAGLCLGIVLTRDGAAGVVFLLIAPFLGGGSLLLGVIPSGILYFQKRQRRDWLSLCLSGCSCLSMVGEWVILGCCRISAC
jgi:hypothetical protein